MTTARAAILQRVAASIDGASPTAPVERSYRRAGSLDRGERVALFAARVADYGADVHRVAGDEIAHRIADVCRVRGCRRVVAPRDLPATWLPDSIELTADEGFEPRELADMDGVVTGCTVAIAETGTIVLSGAVREGRRAITLVPDLHVCVVEAAQIVELVPEAMSILAGIVAAARRPLTFISGPSATSDIELSRVEGVHGPRTLVVLITEGDT